MNAALPEGDLSGLSLEAMYQLIVAGASRAKPFGGGSPAPCFLDQYAIERELGRGGCGAVDLAKPKRGGAGKMAVKIMLSRAQADTRAIAQFKREMDVIAKLRHPNIVRFLDSGSDECTFFFVMEYCDGGSLADVARSHGGKLRWDTLRSSFPPNFSVSAFRISDFTHQTRL